MTGLPSVSVVMPAYNHAEYIACAITSALRQEPGPLEILVVDDGSTDQTSRIVAQLGPSIRYLWQENGGVAAARNRGIAEARGDLVAFLDADDAWCAGYLAAAIDPLGADSSVAAVYTGWWHIDRAGHALPPVSTRVVASDHLYRQLLSGNFIHQSAVVVRREVLLAVGGYDVSLPPAEDWDLWLRIARDRRMVGTPEPLSCYRLHGDNTTRDLLRQFTAMSQVVAKHFGPAAWPWRDLSPDAGRAYGGIHAWRALRRLEAGDLAGAAVDLRTAVTADPSLWTDLDLFYELGLGRQPRGFRGNLAGLDLNQSESDMRCVLERAFDPADSAVPRRTRRAVEGTARFALGILAYGAGDHLRSRRSLLAAAWCRPGLAANRRWAGTLARACVPAPWVPVWRRRRPGGTAPGGVGWGS